MLLPVMSTRALLILTYLAHPRVQVEVVLQLATPRVLALVCLELDAREAGRCGRREKSQIAKVQPISHRLRQRYLRLTLAHRSLSTWRAVAPAPTLARSLCTDLLMLGHTRIRRTGGLEDVSEL